MIRADWMAQAPYGPFGRDPNTRVPDFGRSFDVAEGRAGALAASSQEFFSVDRSAVTFPTGMTGSVQGGFGLLYEDNAMPPSFYREVGAGGAIPPYTQFEDTPDIGYSNPRINVTRIPRPWVDGTMKAFTMGQLVWVSRNVHDTPVEARASPYNNNNFQYDKRLFAGYTSHTRSISSINNIKPAYVTLYSLQRLNYDFARERKISSNTARYPDVFQRMKDFSLDGGVVTQFGGDDTRGYNENGLENIQALVNTAYGGVYIHNYWGDNVTNGTKLFFVVKRVPRPSNEYTINDSDGNSLGIDRADKSIVANPFQVIPWASNEHVSPPLELLEYRDDNGRKDYGAYFEVGTVEYATEGPCNRSKITSVIYSLAALLAQPKIQVTMSMGRLRRS